MRTVCKESAILDLCGQCNIVRTVCKESAILDLCGQCNIVRTVCEESAIRPDTTRTVCEERPGTSVVHATGELLSRQDPSADVNNSRRDCQAPE